MVTSGVVFKVSIRKETASLFGVRLRHPASPIRRDRPCVGVHRVHVVADQRRLLADINRDIWFSNHRKNFEGIFSAHRSGYISADCGDADKIQLFRSRGKHQGERIVDAGSQSMISFLAFIFQSPLMKILRYLVFYTGKFTNQSGHPQKDGKIRLHKCTGKSIAQIKKKI